MMLSAPLHMHQYSPRQQQSSSNGLSSLTRETEKLGHPPTCFTITLMRLRSEEKGISPGSIKLKLSLKSREKAQALELSLRQTVVKVNS